MPVKINIDKMKLRQTIESAWKAGLPVLTKEILDDTNEYCKFDTGVLVQSSYLHTKFNRGMMIWQTPYARRQYWEIQTAYTRAGHPRATWKWAEVAKRHNMEKWQRQANALFNVQLSNRRRKWVTADDTGGGIE